MPKNDSYSRKKATLDLRKNYLIVTEGATESQYFKKFRRRPGPIITSIDGQDSKRSLVNKAIDYRNELLWNGRFIEEVDEAWVVFDRDIDPGNSHDLDNFNQALQVAGQNNFNVAWSNDSFELWFLLHYQDVTRELHRTEINHLLGSHLGESYEKAKGDILYKACLASIDTANRRAEYLVKSMRGIRPADANPCTQVHKLVKVLRSGPTYRA